VKDASVNTARRVVVGRVSTRRLEATAWCGGLAGQDPPYLLMKALAHAQDPGRLQDLVDIKTLLRRFSASIDRRALAVAAAEIGEDVLSVLQPLLSPDHDEDPTDHVERL
jgi:hypothetical protein